MVSTCKELFLLRNLSAEDAEDAELGHLTVHVQQVSIVVPLFENGLEIISNLVCH